MTIYISRPPAQNEWDEGAWAELERAFSLQVYENQAATRVLVQPAHGVHVQGQTNLKDFTHPAGDVVYIFGSDGGHIEIAPAHDHSIYIPQDKTTVTLWSHQAAAIVLWDRKLQEWQ